MTTRHTSAENEYPFENGGQGLPEAAQGIVDLWFVVHGPPTHPVPPFSSISSSGGIGQPDPVDSTHLIAVEAFATYTEYTFRIRRDGWGWQVDFQVPHDSPGTGTVQNVDQSVVSAVITYNENNILKTGSSLENLRVEPARTVYYHEAVAKINFLNKRRCEGVETEDLEEVKVLLPGEDLDIGDGYNMTLSIEDGELTLDGGNGNGLGNAPSVAFGDTEGCEGSSSGSPVVSEEVSLVRTVNGITPADGNVVVATSRLVGKEKANGRLTLIVRRA